MKGLCEAFPRYVLLQNTKIKVALDYNIVSVFLCVIGHCLSYYTTVFVTPDMRAEPRGIPRRKIADIAEEDSVVECAFGVVAETGRQQI